MTILPGSGMLFPNIDYSYGNWDIAYGSAGSFYPALTPSAKSTLTGVDSTALEAALFGKDIPIFVGGEALMGCRIIEGPFLTEGGSPTAPLVSFIATCAVSANPTATRTITSLRLNGTESATSADGGVTWVASGPAFSGITINILTGTETQTPFASSVARYGSRAVAYRSHICVEVIDCPLDVFNNVIPFVSIFVHEADSITRTAALQVLARYARYDDSEFDIDVAGSDTFWIVPQQSEFMQYLQNLRQIFRNWNIVASDKLYIFENSAADGITSTLTRDSGSSFKLRRASPLSIEAQRTLSFIDTERDNDQNSVQARLERFPVPAAASQGSGEVELPIGMTSSAAQLLVNQSLLIDDLARVKLSYTGLIAEYGTDPGDIKYFADDLDITFLGRVTSVVRRADDYAAEITAEQIDFSLLPNIAPVIASNGGGTASISVVENTTAVTTVTATDANHDLLTYSISGGADSALFTINASTGVLAFLVAPDFETPTDADTNNDYIVIVAVTDPGALSDTQTITVTVTNVADGGAAGSPLGLLLTLTHS